MQSAEMHVLKQRWNNTLLLYFT